MSIERKHTARPWVREGRTILGKAFDGSLRIICQVSGGSPESADCNARLIEAAPALIDALQQYTLRGHHDTCSHALSSEYPCDCGYTAGRAAIAIVDAPEVA